MGEIQATVGDNKKEQKLSQLAGDIGLEEFLTTNEISTVICALPDLWSRLMGKRLTSKNFLETVDGIGGVHASTNIFVCNMDMEPRPGYELTGWSDGFSDFVMKPDFSTLRTVPWQKGTALVLCDAIEERTGEYLSVAPRTILRNQLERASRAGLAFKCASELEFFLFKTDYDQAWHDRYRDLVPTSRYRTDYHVLQSTRDENIIGFIRNCMELGGIEIENSKSEWGLGQQEITLKYCDVLEMADRHAVYKHWIKEIVSEKGYSVTFMAKPFIEEVGSSCHIHISLWDKSSAEPISYDAGATGGMSRRFGAFVAGMIDGGREYSYMFAPTVNSYKRFQDNSFAPCQLVLGEDNRTCGFRLVGHDKSFRVEARMPGADANPYLALAGIIASGMDGIDADLDSPEVYSGNAYEDRSLPRVPSTMGEAVALFSGSEKARNALSENVHAHLVNFASDELRTFEQETVTDWELMRYFEQI